MICCFTNQIKTQLPQKSLIEILWKSVFKCVYFASFFIAKTSATILDARPRMLAPALRKV